MAERQAAELQGVIDSELAALRAMMRELAQREQMRAADSRRVVESLRRAGGSRGMLLGRGAAWSA
jgi:hypothetical protein